MVRKIVYLDYLEDGEKKGNGGFLKIEPRKEAVGVLLQVNGLYATDTLVCPVKDELGNAVGELRLERGKGRLESSFASGELPDWLYDGFLEIVISGRRKIIGRWRAESRPPRGEAKRQVSLAGAAEAKAALKTAKPLEAQVSPAQLQAAGQAAEQAGSQTQQAVGEKATFAMQEQFPVEGTGGAGAVQPSAEQPTAAAEQYYADKWEQLCHVFPKIHPFADEREYLSLAPKDFIIFRQQYQKLVHNSFLLHGYYNYQHLILGKFYRNRKVLYYLGTPGVYYEKEKMAAEMFGFEAFEYAGERLEDGRFGYYMRRVEL